MDQAVGFQACEESEKRAEVGGVEPAWGVYDYRRGGVMFAMEGVGPDEVVHTGEEMLCVVQNAVYWHWVSAYNLVCPFSVRNRPGMRERWAEIDLAD
jgi:hypothetical protein